MKYFLYRLIAPRTTFWNDMSETEQKIMQEHGNYWKDLFQKGIVFVFGPVLDPKGVWGVAIFKALDISDAKAICENDPAIKSGAGFNFEVLPMAQAIVKESA